MKKLSCKGFSAVEGLLLILVVILVGGIGYYVYTQRPASENKQTTSQASSQTVTLDTGAASLQLPNDWYTAEHPQEHQQCKDDNDHIYKGLCLDDIYLIPDEKPHADSYDVDPTEDEAELNNPYRYFNMNVSILKNSYGSKTAEAWYKKFTSNPADDKPGEPAKPTETSTDDINGQSGYYKMYESSYEMDDGQKVISKDVTYVILKDDKVVMVSSAPKQTKETVGEKGDGSDNTYEPLDFTRFEPTMQSIINSVQIK